MGPNRLIEIYTYETMTLHLYANIHTYTDIYMVYTHTYTCIYNHTQTHEYHTNTQTYQYTHRTNTYRCTNSTHTHTFYHIHTTTLTDAIKYSGQVTCAWTAHTHACTHTHTHTHTHTTDTLSLIVADHNCKHSTNVS